jgi:hypothetical protein
MGVSALQTAFNLAKGMKDLNTAVAINSAVIELQENILSAQQAQAALVKRIDDLERKVADFEKWDAEKEKYDLKEIHPHNYAYASKPNAERPETPHLICAKCFEDRKKYILQKSSAVHLTCPQCKTMVQFKESQRLQPRTARSDYL